MMFLTAPFLGIVAASFLVYFLRTRLRYNPLANLPGPTPSSWWFGNLRELILSPVYGTHEFKWQARFGLAYRLKGCFGADRVLVSDPTALKAILNDPDTFPRSPLQRHAVWMVTGDYSVFHTEGDDHRRIRGVMTLAFTPARIRTLVPLFRGIVQKVIEEWDNSVSSNPVVMDIYTTINNITMDAIGEGAMGYKFNAVDNSSSNNLAAGHYNVIAQASNRSTVSLFVEGVAAYFPRSILRLSFYLPITSCRALRRFKGLSAQIAADLMEKNKEAMTLGLEPGKDLLGIIAKTSATEHASRKLKDYEICDQVRSMLVAGQDSTAAAVAWSLLALARHPEWQEKVREEVIVARERANGELGPAELESLVFLNAHMKETLRLYPAEPIFERTPREDVVLPLTEPIRTTSGQTITALPIRKGQVILCSTGSYNRIPSIWGTDAHEFNPSRWLNGESVIAAKLNPSSPYANLLSFSGGPRSCPGWRFAILEQQVILAELICRYRFTPPGSDVVIRPCLAISLIPTSADGVPHMPIGIQRLD